MVDDNCFLEGGEAGTYTDLLLESAILPTHGDSRSGQARTV